jgi:hypothetical protein
MKKGICNFKSKLGYKAVDINFLIMFRLIDSRDFIID